LAGNHPITRLSLDYKERKLLLKDALIERKIDYDAIEKISVKAIQTEMNPNRDEGVKLEQKANKANELISKQSALAESEKAKSLVHDIELNESSLNIQEHGM
jgi:hypothetical protein